MELPASFFGIKMLSKFGGHFPFPAFLNTQIHINKFKIQDDQVVSELLDKTRSKVFSGR